MYRIKYGIDKGRMLPAFKGSHPEWPQDGGVLLDDGTFRHMYYGKDEVERVLGRHEGGYDPEHWGELNPDAYDRMSYDNGLDDWENILIGLHGRHLLHTGVE